MPQASRLTFAVLVFALTVFFWPEDKGQALAAEANTLRLGGDYSYLKAPEGRDHKWCEKRCSEDSRCKSWTYIKSRRQCRLKRIIAPAKQNDCCVSGAKKERKARTRRQLCAVFANKAIEQQDENLTKQCGYIGDLWNDDYRRHFRGCMGMTAGQRNATQIGRARGLKRCDSNKKKMNTTCRKFAANAVTIASSVAKNNCSINPEPWIYGYQEALDWCKDNEEKSNDDTFKKVRKELSSCLAYGGGPYIERCDTYARDAIKQYHEANGNECGLRGKGWGDDYKTHYQYCLKVGPWDLRNTTDKRKVELDRCLDQAGKSTGGKIACDHYARLASEQTRSNRKHKCGLKGRRWLADYDRHFAWCKTTSKLSRDQELRYREQTLNKCFERDGGDFNEACDDYAVRSVRQYERNIKDNCNYRGDEWHNSYQRHYKWCVKAKAGQAERRSQQRRRVLKTCKKGYKLPLFNFDRF